MVPILNDNISGEYVEIVVVNDNSRDEGAKTGSNYIVVPLFNGSMR